jgi:AraC-like DNA-binding protein
MHVLALLPPPLLARVRESLGRHDRLRHVPSWDALRHELARTPPDVTIVAPELLPRAGRDDRAFDALAGVPVIGYLSVSAEAVHASLALARQGARAMIVRGVDDRAGPLRAVLDGVAADGLAARLLAALAPQLDAAPAPLSHALRALLARPRRFLDVRDLAAAAHVERRTLDRSLARAGLATARTQLAVARACFAYPRLAPRTGLASIAGALGLASSRTLAREIVRLTGCRPATLRATLDADALVTLLAGRARRAAASAPH